MLDKIIITCAITGSTTQAPKINPAVPVTPKAIAEEAIAAHKAGAAVAHLHVRDPETGAPSMALHLYEEVVDRIRSSDCDILINLTTGPGARFAPSSADPMRGSDDSTMAHPAERVEHVVRLRPDLCSLDVATMTFPDYAFINMPSHIVEMAEIIQAAGVKPELEVFDLGHARLAAELIRKGVIKGRPLFQCCMGIPWSAPATVSALKAMVEILPDNAQWAAFGISTHQFPFVAQAVLMGGHVRVGLEDNLYLSRGQLADGNGRLVERAVKIVEDLGPAVATAAEAREILGLVRMDAVEVAAA